MVALLDKVVDAEKERRVIYRNLQAAHLLLEQTDDPEERYRITQFCLHSISCMSKATEGVLKTAKDLY